MELLTAILSGERNFEMRIFVDMDIPIGRERVLTRRCCNMMNRYANLWRRCVVLFIIYRYRPSFTPVCRAETFVN